MCVFHFCITTSFNSTWTDFGDLHAQISEQASILFEDIMRQDRIPIDFNSPLEPMSLTAYIEDCRIKMWDHAFATLSKKSIDFVGYKGSDLLVRRIIFRLSLDPNSQRISFLFQCMIS